MRHSRNLTAITLFASVAIVLAWFAQAQTRQQQTIAPKDDSFATQPANTPVSERATFAERFGPFK